jgi:hypothetical protein
MGGDRVIERRGSALPISIRPVCLEPNAAPREAAA